MSTTMGACFGGCTGLLVMLIYTRLTTGHAMWDLTMSTNGALTGMVVSSTDSVFKCKLCLLSYIRSSVFSWD